MKYFIMFSFPFVDSDLGYWYITWKVNTRNRGMNLKNTLCTMPPWVGISCKICLLFWYFQLWATLWCLNYRALLNLPNYWTDSWRRYNLKGVGVSMGSWGVSLAWGQVNRIVVEGRKLCMLWKLSMELKGAKR